MAMRVRWFLVLAQDATHAKGALCAVALAKVVGLGVGRASLFPPRFFPMRILRFMALGER